MSGLRRQGRDWTIAALGGVGAALVILSTPVGLVEMLVASSGVTEVVPSAAPPLGLTARLLVAAFAALMTMGTIAALRRDQPAARPGYYERGRKTGVQGAWKMAFALSKLTALARSRRGSPVLREVPVLRRADAHPDAPAREPIYASRDFVGLDIFARTEPGHRALVVKAEPKRDPIVPDAGLDMPVAPPPLPDEVVTHPRFASLISVKPDDAPRPAIASGMASAVPDDDEDVAVPAEPAFAPAAQQAISSEPDIVPAEPAQEQSIAELTARLERGLSLRRQTIATARPAGAVLADLPVASAVPVRDAVEVDIDEALRAALGTLRTMTARGR